MIRCGDESGQRKLMRTIQRLAVFGFFVGQQLQQPIELSLISQRITFRLSYQPSTVRKVLFVVARSIATSRGTSASRQAAPIQQCCRAKVKVDSVPEGFMVFESEHGINFCCSRCDCPVEL
jgi:hypothetical protein